MNSTVATAAEPAGAASPGRMRVLLAGVLEELAAFPDVDAALVGSLRAKLAGRIFNLVVAGEFKRGKSSVINALLGAEVVPTGVVPLTSIVTSVRHGEVPSAEVAFEDGRHVSIEPAALADYVTERANPRNVKQVREVEVAFPAPWLGQGFRLVDTPGIGSAYAHNTDVTRAYLPQADAVIFIASVEQPVSRAELVFLGELRASAGRLFCLLNKTDYLSDSELAESVAFSTRVIREALGTDVPIFPVSARRALQASAAERERAFTASGLAAFDRALRAFLRHDSAEVWIASVCRHLLRLLGQCRLSAELEQKAMAAPLAILDQNLRAFTAKQAEIAQQRMDTEALLQADARRVLTQRVEPALEAFRHDLGTRLDASAASWLDAAEAQHDEPRHVALEHRIAGGIRSAFDAWRRQQDEVVGAAFDRLCGRFRTRIAELADELLHYSADLFEIDYRAIAAEPFPTTGRSFYYKFWQEPGALKMLQDSAVTWLPGAVGRALRLRRARRRIAELIDTQSGRVHYDFDQRIARATREAQQEMAARLDATSAAIQSAIARARELRAGGEFHVAAHAAGLGARIARIDALARDISARFPEGVPRPAAPT